MSNFNFVTDARLANGSYTSNNTANTATIDGWKPVEVLLRRGEKFSDSALGSWGDASDGERIALTARAVLGANDALWLCAA